MEQLTTETPATGATQEDSIQVKVGTDVNGEAIMETVSMNELKSGYLRQSDYTKKTQELAEERKGFETAEPVEADADVDAAKKFLQSEGYLTQAEVDAKLAAFEKRQEDGKLMASFFNSNPDLKQFKGAIETIAKTDDSAIEDIVVKYGFTSTDKLKKAKARGAVGTSSYEGGKEKAIEEMSSTEFAEWKAKAAKNSSDFR